jgi:SpoIID/LytB domain protein
MYFIKNKKTIKIYLFITFCAIFLLTGHLLGRVVYSDEYDDLTKKIADLQTALSQSQSATKPLQTQLTSLKTQLSNIDEQVNQIEEDLIVKKKNIDEGYKNLADKQKIFNITVKNSYIKTYTFSPLLVFLSGNNVSDITSMLTYQKRNTEQDKNLITNVALQLVDLEQKKAELESSQKRLAAAKASLDKDRTAIQKVVDGAVAYQSTLSGQIAALSAQQQQILAQKLGNLNIPLYAGSGAGGCSSDIGKSPSFGGTKFGFFTYGVPNRVGMNQYGAWGRAKASQDDDQILRAYYNFDAYDTSSYTGTQIKVNDSNGYNSGNIIWTGSLEDYVKRIYEIPDSWTDNNSAALKAQAIAARSYVLAETDNGNKSICANQNCQVFKTDPKGGNWDSAVNQTAGKVMIQGGKPIAAYFSSTHGGYVHSSGDIGWSGTSYTKNAKDTSSDNIGSFSDLQNNAYDKASPWFYCDWGQRKDDNTAWLKPEEVADIVNVILLAQKDSSSVKHLYQMDRPNPEGTDTWDAARVRQELGSNAYTSIDNVSVSADFGSGRTTNVTVTGNGKSNNFPADVFVTYFDLRAPNTIYIPQLGKNGDGTLKSPLFNVER